MLGRRMGFMSPNPSEKARNLAVAVKELFAMQRDSYYGFGLWKYFPTRTYRTFVQCEETIYKYVGTSYRKRHRILDYSKYFQHRLRNC